MIKHTILSAALLLNGLSTAVPAETPTAAVASDGIKITRSDDGKVSFAGAKSGMVIRYTLDGSTPSSDSMTYLESFAFLDGGTIKAQAYSTDNRPLGEVVTATFPKVAAPSAVTKLSLWHGFEKTPFMVAGADAFVVAPKIAAPGKPWVWRTSFPDFHAEVDDELLRCGYHVGYVNVVDLLGADRALDVMDQFYTQVLSSWNLSPRPALEGVSRGGLHVYRYAARHPERVSCIYADTPVMDLKVWPLQLPDGKKELQDAFNAYGFKSEADLRAFKGNPLDLLPEIAKAKIPLRHVVSLDDHVVPPETNTLEAKRRLKALGHDMEVVTVEHGTQESQGHHFPLPEAFTSAQFIMRHAYELPAGHEYFQLRYGLENSRRKFENVKTGRIAFVGGSITFNPGWRDELIRYFGQRFPGTKFDFISTGIPSVGSLGHAFRLEEDVLARGPVDLVFVEAAVNDHNYDHLGKDACGQLALRGMEGVVRHLRKANPMCDIVEMHFVHDMDLGIYAKKQSSWTIAAHEKVAEHYGCASLDLSREVFERIEAKEFTWAGDFRNLHPSPYGQRVYANSMMRMLDAAFVPIMDRVYPMPEPLDSGSYGNGRYGKLEDAKLSGGFVLDPNWTPKVRQEVRKGFGNCPALVADAPGAEMRYQFEGTSFGLFLAAGRDTGVVAYSVDGGAEKTVDTWSPWSNALHLPWPIILADSLKPGKHEVVIRTTDQAKGRASLHVIHVLLN